MLHAPVVGTGMPPRRDHILGRLEAGIEALQEAENRRIERESERDHEALKHREAIRRELAEVNAKVDPVITEQSAMKLQIMALEATVGAQEERRKELVVAIKLGRWIIRGFMLIAATLAYIYVDKIKLPLDKLLGLWK